MENILEIKNLTKSYSGVKAVKNVSFNIPRGRIVGLLGPNGSGKTTIIKIVNDLIHDYDGEVKVDGMPVGIESKSIISYLPDCMHIPEHMTPAECINFFKDFYKDFDSQNAKKLFEQMEIPLNKKISVFSKGTKEKVVLALIMSRKAKLYILDEPIAGVDPAARDLILKTILNNFEEGSSMVISTHLINDVENIFDDVIFLKEGEVYLQDEVETIRQKENKSIDQLFRDVFACK